MTRSLGSTKLRVWAFGPLNLLGVVVVLFLILIISSLHLDWFLVSGNKSVPHV